MPSLEGEEHAFQEKRVKDLLDAANDQQTRRDPAIQYFIDGCRDNTLLKHKLMCSEPISLAVLMAKADKYATADSAMRVKVTASDKAVPTPATPKPAGDGRGGQNNNNRKADQMDSCSNSKLVATMEGETSTPQAGPPRKCSNRNNAN
ncbi:Endoglucanase 3 [Hordeum vulgare]|nr:Endoglucanase 3 [Hordeum vulgare]